MANGEIKFKVGFDVNKAGLDNLRQTLSHLKSELGKQIDFSKSLKTDKANRELIEVQTTINNVQNALRNSFNADLGTLNVAKFNAALKNIGIQKIQTDFNKMGAAGQIAFKNLATQAMTTNMQLKQSHSMIDKMATTLGNTLKWNISAGAINRMTGAVQQAWGFTKSLDNSLNDIMIVTGKSADEMERFSRQANKAAKELSAGTTDYTKASLIYYQQGLSDEEVAARAETTLKVANVTGQNADTVSQNLTAVWNGYKVSAEEAELYIDKLSAVAATTAADLDGLSTGMSKVASAANLMGVDVDQLNATLATVISVTQQAPESVGTAFKTIYARMGDIEAGLDTETTLGEYTSKVKEIAGVNVLDTNNQLRDMGEVVEEIGDKWTTLSREQQIALSQAMAGTRQYNNLLSLFDNWDMYTDALNESANAAGTLQEQQETYQQTVEASLQELRTTFEGLYMELFDVETIKDMVDMLTSVMEKIESFVKAIGGGGNALSALGAIATRVFSKQIAQGIATTITNFKIVQDNAAQVKAQFQTIELFGGRQNIAGGDAYLQKLTEMKKSVLDLGNLVTNEQHEQANSIIKTTNELQNQKIAYDESVKQAQEFLHNNLDYRSSKNNKVNLYEKENENGIDYTEDFDPSSAEKANAALNKIKGNIEKSNDAILRAKVAIKEYSNSIEDNGKKHTQTKQKLQEAVGKIKEEIESVQKLNTNLKESSSIRKEYQKTLDNANAAYNKALSTGSKKEILRTGQDLLNVHTEINEKMSKEAEKTGKVIAQQSENTGQKIQKDIENAGDAWKNFINNLQTVKNIQSFVQILGGINQIASGLRSLSNLAKIWNDEDLSFGEKAFQIISAISMGLSMIMSGTLAVVTLLPILTGLVNKDTVAKEANAAATAKGGIANTAFGKSIAGLITKFKAMSTAAKVTSLSIGGLVAILSIAAIAYGAYADSIERKREKAIADTKATLEEVKAKQEESKKVEELTDNYSKLYQQYKETGKVSEEFKTAADDVIEALGVQDVAVLKLTGDYAELTKKILESKQAKLEADKEAAEEGVEGQNKTISNILNIEKKSDNNTGGAIRESSGIDTENLEGKNFLKIYLGYQAGIQSDDDAFADEIDYTELLQEVGLNYFSNASNDLYIEKGNMEAGKFYGKLLEVEKLAKERYSKEEYERSNFYEYLQDIKGNDELKEAYQAWEEQSKLLTDATAELALYNNKNLIYSIPEIENQKQYEEKKAGVKEALRNTKKFETEDELEKATTDLFSQYLTSEKVKNYEERIAFSEEIGKKISPELVMPVKGAENEKILEDYNKDKQKRQNIRQEIEDEIADLSDEEFSALTTVVDIDRLKSKEIFDAYVDYARQYAKAQEIELKISVTEDLANGKKITDLTEEQQNALKELESEYPELQAIQDKTSSEYISNLLQIQQLLEEQRIEAEEKATDVLIQYALELDVDTDEFEETMKDIAEQQYKVVVAVKADVQSDFDNLVDNMTDIDSMASKIGDDFIVAASDLEELNDMFPGILENMKITEDGSVQLNSTIAKEAIEASKAQIKADTAATVEKLLNQAKEMEAKRDAARNVAKILRDSITNEEVADTAKADLDNALQILKSDNSASLAEQEQSDTKNVAETAAASATEMANNYGEAYKKMSEDAIEWAKTAQNAIKASTDINVNIPELPVNFGGLNLSSSVTIKESDKADLQSSEEMDGLTDADKEEIAAYYDSVGDSWDRLASNTFGKAMELMAREEESENKLNNIQSGKGADGQKDGSKEPDKEDKIDEEIDRYREVNELLARQEKSLNKLQKEQDKLYGKSLIKNLEEQSKILKEQEETLRRKLEIAREESKELKNEISQQGIEFDNYGYIINYEEAIQAKQDELNTFIDAYNKMSKEEQENHKEELQKRKENFEEFKTSVDRYATLINEEIPEIATSISNSTVQQAENKIKAFEIEIEVKLDMNEAKRQWASFMKDYYYRDNPRGQAEQLYNTAKVEYSDFTIQRNAAQDTQKEIDKLLNGKDSIYKNTEEGMKKAKEDFTNYYQEALSSYQDTFNAVEESKQLWLTGIDDTINTLNENAEVYSQLDSLYNHDKNMITMLYGEDAFESLDKIYEKMNTNNQKEIINIKKRKDYYKEMMDAAANDEEREKWKQAWLNATDELNAKTEETVSLILEKHSKTIESIIDAMNKSLTNGLGLEYIGKEWDLIQKQSEQYFDSVEKGFELQGLQNSFDEALDATDSIAGQARINKLMEEQMNMLREKDKLTKYDVDRAQLLLDIELKRIALEEARQNKSTMRLRRDAQGNYSYQYVEDEEATKAAEEDLQKSEYDLYELDKGQVETSADNILSTYNEITEEIARIQNDNTLTQEERDAELKLLEDRYGDILQTDLDNFSQASKNLGEEGLKNIFGEDSETLAFIKSLNEKGIGNYINEIVSKTNDVVEDTQDEIDKTRDKAGEDSKKGEGAYTDNDVDETTVEDFKKNMSDLITKENEKLDALKQSYDNGLIILGDIKNEFSSLNKLYHYLLKLQGIEIPTSSTTPSDTSGNKKNPSGDNKPTPPTAPTTEPTTSTTPTVIDATQPTFTPSHTPLNASWTASKTSEPIKNGVIEIGDEAIFDRGYYSTYSNADISSPTLKYNSSTTVMITDYKKGEIFPVQIGLPNNNGGVDLVWVQEKDLYQYKTGGLVDKTGPAWLDGTKSKPELVLNSKDTQNLLDTIKILRNADSLANSLNRSMSERMEARLNTEFKRLSNMMDIIKIERESDKDSLEQNVHIDADFPNVSDSNEIEQALMNLVNVASQYAYRR